MTARIFGTGSYLPEEYVDNHSLSLKVDTSDEWIRTRTGIAGRHIAKEETTSQMAAAAADRALQQCGWSPEEVDLILVATSTPDTLYPSVACSVQKLCNAGNAVCMDINAACSGFLYALATAHAYIQSGICTKALVIGAERLSGVLDWNDRSTCVLFGDGAGAAAVGRDDAGIVDLVMFSDGRGGDVLQLKSGGTMTMSGREVFEFAVRKVPESIRTLLERARMGAEEVDHYLLHQANARIIQTVAKRLKVSVDKFPVNLDHCGNTSAASIPILIDEMNREGRLLRGEKVVLSGFGAGLTWGAVLLIW